MTRRNWLDTHIARCETLLTELYLERDARIVAELDEPQVVTEMAKLKASVSARRHYENKVKANPALLEAHRKRAREGWRRKQGLKQAGVVKKLSFTLTV